MRVLSPEDRAARIADLKARLRPPECWLAKIRALDGPEKGPGWPVEGRSGVGSIEKATRDSDRS